jgi:Mg-chelatase subunit ChlD
MTKTIALAVGFAGLAIVTAPRTVLAEEPSLATVMQRAAAYVVEFQRQLSSIVAEEVYVQDIIQQPERFVNGSHRELRSDLLLIRPAGADRYVDYRDVFAVDGNPVRDRQDRLTGLFLESSPSAPQQIGRIKAESARYNIGNITRTVNTPTLALSFLDPNSQPRFRFRRAAQNAPANARPAGPNEGASGTFRVSTEVWVVEYQETQSHTLIRTKNGKDLPARGRFWIEPTTGRVLLSELIAQDHSVRATIDVSYQSEPLLGFLVPIEMRERYVGRRFSLLGDVTVIDGNATYGRFRQFQVHMDEHVVLPARNRIERLYVAARDRNGSPVLDLGASDFNVKEGDTNCRVVRASLGTEPTRIVLLVDNSDATVSLVRPMRVALQAFVDAVPAKDEIGLVTFEGRFDVRVPPTTDRAPLQRALTSLSAEAGSRTGLIDSLLHVREQLIHNVESRWPVFVVVTADHAEAPGASQTDFMNVMSELQTMRATVHAVVFSNASRPLTGTVAGDLVERTGGDYERVSSAADLTAKVTAIALAIAEDQRRLANRYEVDYISGSTDAEPTFEVGVVREGVTLDASRRRRQ